MRRLALATALLLAAATLGAVELDFIAVGQGTFTEGTQQYAGELEAVATQQFDQDNVVTARARGSLDASGAPDLSLLQLEYAGDFPTADGAAVVNVLAGRRAVVENSGFLAPLTLDGVTLGYKMPGLIIQGLATTTALLRPEESLLLTASDRADAADDSLFFGPQRYLAGLFLVLPETVGTANIYVQYLAQIDGRGFTAETGDDLYNSHYLISGVIGPLAPRLFGSLFAMGNYGHAEVAGTGATHYIGYGARAELRSFIPTVGRPTGTVSVLFASGDRDGAVASPPSGEVTTLFAPGPYRAPWKLADIPVANVIATTVRGTFLPLDWASDRAVRRTRIVASTTAIFRPWSIDPGAAGVDPSAESGWYGTELEASLRLEPFTDLDIRTTGAIFLPVGSDMGGVYPAGSRGSWRITIDATLAF